MDTFIFTGHCLYLGQNTGSLIRLWVFIAAATIVVVVVIAVFIAAVIVAAVVIVVFIVAGIVVVIVVFVACCCWGCSCCFLLGLYCPRFAHIFVVLRFCLALSEKLFGLVEQWSESTKKKAISWPLQALLLLLSPVRYSNLIKFVFVLEKLTFCVLGETTIYEYIYSN